MSDSELKLRWYGPKMVIPTELQAQYGAHVFIRLGSTLDRRRAGAITAREQVLREQGWDRAPASVRMVGFDVDGAGVYLGMAPERFEAWRDAMRASGG